VHLEGSVSLLVGRCPNLQFLVSGTPVVANASTDFRKKAKCDDLSNGDRVTVDGVRAGAVVVADSIEIKRNEDQ
jgi:hypothetical protein